MQIEDKIFTNHKPNFKKLLNFGFKKVDDIYTFSTEISDTDLLISLTVNKAGQLTGKVIDKNFNSEYNNFRSNQVLGSFTSDVKKKYTALLKKVAEKCFDFNPVTTGKEWIIPANPKYFDLAKAFAQNPTITWKQSTNIKANDIVYIYVAAPVSALIYKCLVLATNIPYDYHDKNLAMKYVMKIRLINTYKPAQYPLDKLKALGVKAVRGPRHLPKELTDDLNKN